LIRSGVWQLDKRPVQQSAAQHWRWECRLHQRGMITSVNGHTTSSTIVWGRRRPK
jgi:hypothetical protein